MKKNFIIILLLCSTILTDAQLVITPNQTASYLANKLLATSGTLGVTITNAVLTCDTNANGEFTGTSNLGITDGIVIGSGDVASNVALSTFGLDGLPSNFASNWNNSPGDGQLDTIISGITYDACILEFDLQPVGSFIEFEYVFGSEEYPEFICAFNDVFGFFISGPGFSTPTNIALIPSTSTYVAINTINDGSGSCLANTALYVNNTGTSNTMDGFTTPLIATANVTSGANYHLKLAIADASDGIFNSYAIIKANSLKSGNPIPTSINQISNESGIAVYPTLMKEILNINNLVNDSWNLNLINIDGRIVMTHLVSNNQGFTSLDISTLDQGIYLLQAQRSSDGKRFIEKLIKE